MTEPRVSRVSGKVRVARLTDLAALGELSRLCQSDEAATRSLGLPVSGPPIGVFSLFRLPLGAFRPHDLMYVYEQDGRIAGLVRVEREATRDEWTIVELDAVGVANAGEIRYRLVQQLLREGAKRGAVRFHVACADADDNIELFMQAGFMRYGDERILFRPTSLALPEPWSDEQAADCRIRPTAGVDAVALSRLYASATPQPVQRLEAVRINDWGAPGDELARPALEPGADPALRRRRGVRAGVGRWREGRDGPRRVHPGRRRQGGPATLSQGDGAIRCGRVTARRVRSRRDRREDPEGRRPSPRPGRHRTGADLRVADRSAARGGVTFTLYAPNPTDIHAAHSIYFQVLGEHGFVGLFLFLLLWWLTWRTAVWIRKNTKPKGETAWAYHLAAMSQVSLVGFLVGGAFLSLAYFDLPYYIVVALIATKWILQRESTASQVVVPAQTGANTTAAAGHP